MTKTVIAQYNRFQEAFDTVRELIKRGIERERISLITQDPYWQNAQESGFSNPIEQEDFDRQAMENQPRGASASATMGGISRLLDEVRAQALPGIGPAIAAGPMAAALGSAKTGGPARGVIGALREIGVTDEDAQSFHDGIRRGGTLVTVDITDMEESERPIEIMNRYKPADLRRQTGSIGAENWTGFKEEAEPFPFHDQTHPYKERAPASTLDFGKGADELLPGRAIGQYDMGPTESSRYMGKDADAWEKYEPNFREHFQQHYAGAGKRWDDFRDAYRFGYDMAHLHPSMNQEWETLRDYAQQNWTARNLGKDWEQYKDAVRNGWETACKSK